MGGCTNGHRLYLNELRLNLPNWGTTLDNLAKNYCKNLPKIGVNINVLGTRIQILESKRPVANSPSKSFFNLGSSWRRCSRGTTCVPKTEFDQAKVEIQEAFMNLKKAIQTLKQGGSGWSGTPHTSLHAKVDKALKWMGEIEGRVTGESFSMNNQTFCSRSEVADWLLAEKVPSCSFFWDLFNIMVSMKPKKHSRKEQSDENYSV
jgi:hypothetical protein